MRRLTALLVVSGFAACSNDVEPRLIAGGGIGDGDIDGELNVYVIDSRTDAVIANATVVVGDTTKTTDAKGLAVFSDVNGPQTIAVKADSYRSSVWVKANGANCTVPITPLAGTPEQATLAGSIANWSAVTVPTGHVKGAIVIYSQSDDLGDDANNLQTPNNGNFCLGATDCNWTIVTRTGTVTLAAAIIDRDTKNTPLDPNDDTTTVIGYATKAGIVVNNGVNQSGLVLDQVEAGNLENVTVDTGTPPAGLPDVVPIIGIEISKDEVLQNPLMAFLKTTTILSPKRTVFGADATYRLSAIAQTSTGDAGAQSIQLRRGGLTPDLVASEWLVPPVDVMATRSMASWSPVARAAAHSVIWKNTTSELLEITVFDPKTTSVEVPSAVALPTSGALTAKVQGIGADFNVNDFSLEEDSSKLWGVAAQPVSIP